MALGDDLPIPPTAQPQQVHPASSIDSSPDGVTPITLSFKELTATLPNGREILSDVSGVVKPGGTLALLGSSGAGKTTLLSILANLPRSFSVQGNVYFNGQKAKASSRKRFCSLVTQETAFMGDFTVRETLRYAALFQLGYMAVTSGLIDGVIAKVGLTSCADSKIGSLFFKGISGGQQRRLALAMELLKKPSIIFLDEPLTNLDSTGAYQIALQLQKLARQQHTIVFSAHTPSSRLLDSFDQLIVLSRGKVAYFGKADKLSEYLNDMGKGVPDNFNPCDHLMHLVTSDTDLVEMAFARSPNRVETLDTIGVILSDRKAKVDRLTQAVASLPPEKASLLRRLSRRTSKETLKDDEYIDDVDVDQQPSMLSRVSVLAHRALLGSVRNPGIFFIRLGFFSGVAFYLGALYFVTIFSFLGILSVPFIIDDAKVYAREKHNGAYGSMAFTVTMFLRSVVFTGLFALLCSVLTVYMGKLSNFWLYFTAVWATLLFAEAYSIMWSMITRDYLVAMVVIMASVAGMMILSGFFVVFDQIPWVVRWMGYASAMRYSFRATLEQQFSANQSLAAGTPMASGSSVLAFLGVDGEPDYWGDIGVLLGMCALCFAAVGVVFEKLW